MGAFLAAAAPAAIAAVGSLFGQRSANRANVREAQRNRDFQERMRNTQWQAGLEDMRAAGLNPALAYSQGGAASPGGSQATIESETAAAVANAQQAAMMSRQMKLLDAQIAKTTVEGVQTQVQTQRDLIARGFEEARAGYFFDQQGRPKGELLRLIRSELVRNEGSSAFSVAQAQNLRFTTEQQKQLLEVLQKTGMSGDMSSLLGPLILRMVR